MSFGSESDTGYQILCKILGIMRGKNEKRLVQKDQNSHGIGLKQKAKDLEQSIFKERKAI
jgi:hypothetical protein